MPFHPSLKIVSKTIDCPSDIPLSYSTRGISHLTFRPDIKLHWKGLPGTKLITNIRKLWKVKSLQHVTLVAYSARLMVALHY
jgi:hypothetical protein